MIIGVDVGGTKTHVRARDADGESRDVRLPTASWLQGRSLEHPASVDALLAVIESVAPGSEWAPLAVGAHGCDTPDQIAAFREALAARRSGSILVTNDAALVGPAAGFARTIGVIAGTGSIVVGADLTGSPITAGGHGWMIADPGSAPGIVRAAVRAVLDHADTGAEPDVLSHRLMAHYATSSPNDLAWVFTTGAGIHRWAEAAPLVFAAADDGSALAAETVRGAGEELADQVAHVLRRGAVADAVIAAGGVVTNQPRLAMAIREGLLERKILIPFHVLDTPPVAGAVALGARLECNRGTTHPSLVDD